MEKSAIFLAPFGKRVRLADTACRLKKRLHAGCSASEFFQLQFRDSQGASLGTRKDPDY
jgi:hypothetical protein